MPETNDIQKPKILVLDIETKLVEAYTFSIRDTHITHKQIKDFPASARTIHCVGIKWIGQKKVTVLSEWEHGYSEMIRRTHEALSEADAVVTYNGAAFDLPKLNGQFMLEGIPLPPPLTQIDLYKAARKLGFICNKLDYIAQIMGLGSKVKHPGLEMWIACFNGCPKAQKRMAKYCAGDINLTEDVYQRLLPYISDHPHLGDAERDACGACGSSRLQSRGGPAHQGNVYCPIAMPSVRELGERQKDESRLEKAHSRGRRAGLGMHFPGDYVLYKPR